MKRYCLLRRLRTLGRDDSGQGLVFAAISFMMLILAVGLVYNVGQITNRKIQTQLAADAMAYSGALVQADALSAIAVINDGMAQIYSRLLQYVRDVTVYAVLAEFTNINHRKGYTPPTDAQILNDSSAMPDTVIQRYRDAYARAYEWIPRAKQWLLDLSRVQNTIALVTPRLVQAEMDLIKDHSGIETAKVFPSGRFFPRDVRAVTCLVEKDPSPDIFWRVTKQEPDPVELFEVGRNPEDPSNDNSWRITYKRMLDPVNYEIRETVTITQYDKDGDGVYDYWVVVHDDLTSDPPKSQTVEVYYLGDAGWAVASGGTALTFQKGDFDEDGVSNEWKISGTENGKPVELIFKREDGDMFVWQGGEWKNLTTPEMSIGGSKVSVNTYNSIHIGNMTIWLSNRPRVCISKTSIVLMKPPKIDSRMGPVQLRTDGDFAIGVRWWALLTVKDADGIWRKYFDQYEEYFWQHRLTPIGENTWLYEYQEIGPYLQYETNGYRFGVERALRDSGIDPSVLPKWCNWLNAGVDPTSESESNFTPAQIGGPFNRTYKDPSYTDQERRDADPPIIPPAPPSNVYYQTIPCWHCGGDGFVDDGVDDKDSEGKPIKDGQPDLCKTCLRLDHDGDGVTDVRIYHSETYRTNHLLKDRWPLDFPGIREDDPANAPDDYDFMDLRIFKGSEDAEKSYGIDQDVRPPLVLTEEFFKFGINVGVWREKESGVMSRLLGWEPAWGVQATSSARAGLLDDSGDSGQWVYRFPDAASREEWIQNSSANLYSPFWAARLVTTRDQISTEDLESLVETGTNYLYRALVVKRNMRKRVASPFARNLDGALDLEAMNDGISPGLADVVKH